MLVDLLDVQADSRKSDSRDIVDYQVDWRRVVVGKRHHHLRAEEQVDRGVGNVELDGGGDCGGGEDFGDSGEGDAFFDRDDGRNRDADRVSSVGAGVRRRGPESESHLVEWGGGGLLVVVVVMSRARG